MPLGKTDSRTSFGQGLVCLEDFGSGRPAGSGTTVLHSHSSGGMAYEDNVRLGYPHRGKADSGDELEAMRQRIIGNAFGIS